MKNGSKMTYGIGAVVRHTGLSAPNIRMWEKRYNAVVPTRTETNRRLYTADDVEKLTLLRLLTERGHSIKNIANLSLPPVAGAPPGTRATLAPPLDQALPARAGPPSHHRGRRGRVPLRKRNPRCPARGAIRGPRRRCAPRQGSPGPILLVICVETLQPETLTAIREIVKTTKAPSTILVYQFTAAKTAMALARAIPGLTLLAGPVGDDELRRECLLQLGASQTNSSGLPRDPGSIPERLYTLDQLSRLTRLSTTVECECPQHLAGLLQSLSAFEKYSRECEDRNPQDALLHAFLHRTTAQVRRTMEEALQHVVQVEGIDLA